MRTLPAASPADFIVPSLKEPAAAMTRPADAGTPSPAEPAIDRLADFGFIRLDEDTYALPPCVIALQANATEHHPPLIDMLKAMEVPYKIALWAGERRQAFFRLAEPTLADTLSANLPNGVSLVRFGERIDLLDFDPDKFAGLSFEDLTELDAAAVARVPNPRLDPLNARNPLMPFTLRGQSERFKQLAIEARPLLGDVCLRGQVTVWYAAPNTGKTLIALSLLLDAVRKQRIAAGNIYYVNADDNGQGLATKLKVFDDIGANILVPGFQGFDRSEFITLLHKMADKDEARGLLVIIDTIKKFASVMDKREASEFAQACRRVSMVGGTVLGLAHTNKNPNADGSPRYAGTTDLVDDADAAYTLRPLAGGIAGEQAVEFSCFKSRGASVESAAYAFASGRDVSYEDKLASVRPVDPEEVDQFQRIEAQRSDGEIIDSVAQCIAEGVNTKMLLMKEVAERVGISGRAASRVIEKYTGEDAEQHRWRFVRGSRGAHVFQLLAPPAPT